MTDPDPEWEAWLEWARRPENAARLRELQEVPGRIVCVVAGLAFLSLVWLVVGFVIGHLCR